MKLTSIEYAILKESLISFLNEEVEKYNDAADLRGVSNDTRGTIMYYHKNRIDSITDLLNKIDKMYEVAIKLELDVESLFITKEEKEKKWKIILEFMIFHCIKIKSLRYELDLLFLLK